MEAADVKEFGELLVLEKKGQQLSLLGRDVALVNQDARNFSQAAKWIAANARIALPIRPRTRSTDLERTIRKPLAGTEIAHNVFDIVAEWSAYEGKRGY